MQGLARLGGCAPAGGAAVGEERGGGGGGRNKKTEREETKGVETVERRNHRPGGGAPWGHKPRGWNPKMRPFIFTARNGIHILDLQKTVPRLNEAYQFISNL